MCVVLYLVGFCDYVVPRYGSTGVLTGVYSYLIAEHFGFLLIDKNILIVSYRGMIVMAYWLIDCCRTVLDVPLSNIGISR